MVGTATSPGTVRPLDLIGNTPLVELARVGADLAPGVRVLAKAEMANPGGSVKDRPALSMIRDGIARGLLTPGKVILEATSGNTGIALAMIGTAMGFGVELCLPENASPEENAAFDEFHQSMRGGWTGTFEQLEDYLAKI